jgi:hypothetical protein
MADVIFSVRLTEAMRPLISFNDAMLGYWNALLNEKMKML